MKHGMIYSYRTKTGRTKIKEEWYNSDPELSERISEVEKKYPDVEFIDWIFK